MTLPYSPTLSLDGAGLAPPFSSMAVLDSGNHFSFPSVQSRIPSLAVDLRTGLLKGSLRATGAATIPFGGVFLQQQRSGFGCFVSPAASGSLELKP